jgi:membrane protein DedA with SNARE-associated domain
VLESVAQWLKDFVETVGYPGLFLLVMIESTVVPVPSEIVLPFAGWLAADGKMSLVLVLVINSAAALVGSSLSYWFGAAGGKKLLLKYGKYIFLTPADIERTERFFARRGRVTVLVARFVPVVRHVISIPAGVARMPLRSFLLQTFIGATVWGSFLIMLGYELGAEWESVAQKLKKFDLAIGVVIILVFAVVVVRFISRRRRERAENAAASTAENKAD